MRVRVRVRVRMRVRAPRRLRARAAVVSIHGVLRHRHRRASVRCRDVGVVDLSIVELVLRGERLRLRGHGVVRGDRLGGMARGAEGGMVLVRGGGIVVLWRVAGWILSATGPLCGERDVCTLRVLVRVSVRHWRDREARLMLG